MKINELINELRSMAVLPVNEEKTVDVIKVGDGEAEITRVGIGMFATPEVIKRAVKQGINFLIVHEPLFYTHRDTEMPYDQCFEKKKIIEEAGLTVFRFHDYAHSMSPDVIYEGQLAVSGLRGHFEKGKHFAADRFILDEEMTTVELARILEAAYGAEHFRIVGDRENKVKRISCCFGTPGHLFEEIEECDAVLTGEICEWGIGEYVRDAAQMGRKKSMIVMGHINSEKQGMKLLCDKLTLLYPELAPEFIDCGDIYSYTQSKSENARQIDFPIDRYKNIMELAKESGYKKIRIKRNTWGNSWGIVEKVSLKRNGRYGFAYGHIHYSNGNIVDGEIKSAGTFAWKTIEILNDDMEVEYL